MSGVTALPVSSDPLSQTDDGGGGEIRVLVLAWSAEQPSRAGEIAVVTEGKPYVLAVETKGTVDVR
jgi:hypothetical protein